MSMTLSIVDKSEVGSVRVDSDRRSQGAGGGGGGGGRGHRGHAPPKLLVNFPINLRCYVLLGCRVKQVILVCLKN